MRASEFRVTRERLIAGIPHEELSEESGNDTWGSGVDLWVDVMTSLETRTFPT